MVKDIETKQEGCEKVFNLIYGQRTDGKKTKITDERTDKEQTKNEQMTVNRTMNRVRNNKETRG